LRPGEYVLKLQDRDDDSNIVQVYDRDEKHLITSVMATPAYRLEPSDHTQFTFYESPANQPMGLRTWFYPGDTDGFQFQNVPSQQ